jgi:multiple sugar transport system substrate-binding protein
MQDPVPQKRITRRKLVSSAARLVAATSLAPIAAACVGAPSPSPAASGSASPGASGSAKLSGSLSILIWSHFVPAYDDYLKKFADSWGSKNGVSVVIDHVNQADLPARAAAESASKSGHDIFAHFAQGLPALFENDLVDITDICEAAGQKYGGWLDAAVSIGKVNGKWRGYPDFFIPFPSLWRKDAFTKVGLADGPKTWQDLLDAAPKLKTAGNPVGTAYSQTSDAEQTWRSLLWSFGGGEFSADGKTVTIDSAETRAALTFAKNLLPSLDPAVLSWGDADNNTCLQSGRCAWIYNPISAYRSIEGQNPQPAFFKDLYVNLPLAGPKAQICSIQWVVFGIWSFSKNVPAAKQFLTDYIPDFQAQAEASKGYNNPFLKDRLKKPMAVLGSDAKLSVLQDVANNIRAIGYPGPATKAAFDSLNTHIVTDMFTNYATNKKSLDDSIADAKKRLSDSLAKFPS